MIVIYLDTNDKTQWVQLTGTDYGTGYEFEGDEFGITPDERILDCDGAPLTESDHVTIAIRNNVEV